MNITRCGEISTVKSTPEYFRGTAISEVLFLPKDTALASGVNVTFEPGSCTDWHSHPMGQALIVTAGMGWIQSEGGSVEEIRAGDVVWIPANEKHWHGATDKTAMTHIAIQEAKDGKTVTWDKKVSDDEYRLK